ncbi:MAG: glycosyltransferase family 9 protein [Gemmatimonadaceae bacterium]
MHRVSDRAHHHDADTLHHKPFGHPAKILAGGAPAIQLASRGRLPFRVTPSDPGHLHHVLVSRTDGIGDVVLTLPLCGLLGAVAGRRVTLLARGYTRAVAEASAVVNDFLDWDVVASATPAEQRDFIAGAASDAIVHAFPERSVARAAFQAKVPHRIGTSHRLYHWLYCNDLEHFTRRRSPLHEAQLNVRLARRVVGSRVPPLEQLAPLARLVPRADIPPDIVKLIDPNFFTLIVHPTSHGSAGRWPLNRWGELVGRLSPARFRIFVTGSQAESTALGTWTRALPVHVVDIAGRLTLDQLIAFLARADGLIAASTGPLHLAAAVGINALGLFSSVRPVDPGRWAPLGPLATYLTPGAPELGVGAIPVETVAVRVERWAADRAARPDSRSQHAPQGSDRA